MAIRNHGSGAERISIFDAYSGKTDTRVVHPGNTATFVTHLKESFGWYNLTIRVDSDPSFRRQLAGHLETGRPSMSDPAISASAAQVALESFFAKLWYKAASAGREGGSAWNQGQVCVCGAEVPRTLAVRWHACPVCGLSAPRDVVTAQVILERARIERSRHNAEDVVSCVPREAAAFQPTE